MVYIRAKCGATTKISKDIPQSFLGNKTFFCSMVFVTENYEHPYKAWIAWSP